MSDPQVEDIVKCPECGSRDLDRDETRGEIVCSMCGLLLVFGFLKIVLGVFLRLEVGDLFLISQDKSATCARTGGFFP